MESDHNASYSESITDRNGARTARPRLADLLESVKMSDESPNNGITGGTNSGMSSGVSNGIDSSANGTYAAQERAGSVSVTVAQETATLAPVDFDASSRTVTSEPSAFGEQGDVNDTDGLAAASIAAQKRRQALYARRNNDMTTETDIAHQPSPNLDNKSATVDNGSHSSGREFDSLASRLFGERGSSSFDSTETSAESTLFAPSDRISDSTQTDSTPTGSTQTDSTQTDSTQTDSTLADSTLADSAQLNGQQPIDSLLNGASSSATTTNHWVAETSATNQAHPNTDWTAKYSADAPLSSAPGLSAPGLPVSGLPASEQPASNLSAPDLSAGIQSTNRAMANNNPSGDPQLAEYEQPATRRFSTTSPASNETLNAVNIKGRSDGVSIELGQGTWPAIMDALSQRLVQSTGFFRGGKVTLDVGVRPLQENELQEICDLTEQHGLIVTSVRSRSEQSCQVALAAGLAASLDAPDGLLAQPALSNYEKLEHFVYRGNLRSGQILRRAETILVMGDVNPGSQIISDSDILVWGRLRGIAHAGASGDTNGVIAALLMEPTQIRIADAIAILPEQETKTSIADRLAGNTAPSGVKRPEIAHSIGEDIIVDVWDDSKPGGIMAFRRSII